MSNLSNAENVKIFLVQSYSSSDLCGMPQLKGAIDTLKKSSFNKNNNTTIYTFFMETKKKNTTKKQIEKIADKAYRQIRKVNPNVVFLFDDAAFMELAPKLIHTRYKVVFSGVNKPLEKYNKALHFMDKNRNPTANITGVHEKLHIYDSIKFIESIIGKKGIIAVIYSDDIMGKILQKQILSELKNTEYHNMLKTIEVNNVKKLITVIRQINKDKRVAAYILNTESIADKKGSRLNMFNSIPIAVKYAQKPDIAINTHFCKNGLLGGAAVNFYAMGAQAAQLAIKMLNNTPIKTLKIEDAEKADRVINIKRAKQLNIKIPLYIMNALDAVY